MLLVLCLHRCSGSQLEVKKSLHLQSSRGGPASDGSSHHCPRPHRARSSGGQKIDLYGPPQWAHTDLLKPGLVWDVTFLDVTFFKVAFKADQIGPLAFEYSYTWCFTYILNMSE